KEVLRLWWGGAAKKRIAAQLGLDIKTVRRYLRAAVACGVRPGGEAPSEEQTAAMVAALLPDWGRQRGEAWAVCAAQRQFIVARLEDGVRCPRSAGCCGVVASSSLMPRCAASRWSIGFGRLAATIPVADGEPGDELQIDT